MKFLTGSNRQILSWFVKDYQKIDSKQVRVQHGLVAGWVSISAIVMLFAVKMTLGLMAGSVSIVANAFHLLSHLANSIILVVSFKVTAKPATSKTPFGHGRMEHIAPLVMSIFLFVSGIQIGEEAIHQSLHPHEVHYWASLPWILLATVIIKQWLSQFVNFLGSRVNSRAIKTTAHHHRIEAVLSLAVIGGLIAGHYFHHPEVDGYIGILVAVWLLYLGYSHGREALVPLLGQAPTRDMIEKIRTISKTVEGVEDVHEIIVHDYGSLYFISLHVEIPGKYGPADIHEITEKCEKKLRSAFGGEVVCHSDPLVEKSPEIEALEKKFKRILAEFPPVLAYHDFRVVIESSNRYIILADIDVKEDIPESEFQKISDELNKKVLETIDNIAYCGFYITPKFAY